MDADKSAICNGQEVVHMQTLSTVPIHSNSGRAKKTNPVHLFTRSPACHNTAGKSTHSEAVYLLNWLSLAGPRPTGVRVSRCCPRCSVVAPPASCAVAARWCSEGPCDSCLPDGKMVTAKQSDRQKEGSNPCSSCNFVYTGFYTSVCVCVCVCACVCVN